MHELKVRSSTRRRVLRATQALNWNKLFNSSKFAEDHFTIAEYANERQRSKPEFIDSDLYHAIRWLGSHHGSALLMRRAIPIPLFRPSSVEAEFVHHSYTRKVERMMKAYMGAAGFFPLPEYFEKRPEYIVHARGAEYLGDAFNDYRFKLPHAAATTYPHKPFGPGLFGDNRAERLDAISPDICAFLFLDVARDVIDPGPVVFCVDEIKSRLSNEYLDELLDKTYRIEPDPAVTRSSEMGFGGVSKINVIGHREDTNLDGPGRWYFRYIEGQTRDENGRQRALRALDIVLEEIRNDFVRPKIRLGDVLLVNNRRSATRWSRRANRRHVLLGWFRTGNVNSLRELCVGDRVVGRMSFFSPTEINQAEGASWP